VILIFSLLVNRTQNRNKLFQKPYSAHHQCNVAAAAVLQRLRPLGGDITTLGLA